MPQSRPLPYTRVDFIPQSDFGFGLCIKRPKQVASGLEDGGKAIEESIYSTVWERCKQRGLKYTEHKPVGRHYLGVTRTTNEFRSSHPYTSERDLLNLLVLTPPVASRLFVLRFYGIKMTQWTPEKTQGYPRGLPCTPYLIDDHVRSTSCRRLPVAGIGSVLPRRPLPKQPALWCFLH
jgi:hypothetical protein